jgi:hypothetical protein
MFTYNEKKKQTAGEEESPSKKRETKGSRLGIL